jgi:hypothetical protein
MRGGRFDAGLFRNKIGRFRRQHPNHDEHVDGSLDGEILRARTPSEQTARLEVHGCTWFCFGWTSVPFGLVTGTRHGICSRLSGLALASVV